MRGFSVAHIVHFTADAFACRRTEDPLIYAAAGCRVEAFFLHVYEKACFDKNLIVHSVDVGIGVLPAYEVAYAVGFDNYPYFYQLYKKKTGKSPFKEKAG